MEKPPRPGRGMVRRAAIASLLIILMSAGAVSAAAFLQVDELVDIITENRHGRKQIDSSEITPAEAGKPQTIMILGTDQRLGADAALTETARSDTILLVRMDARKPATTVMSIPRDFKVQIPGFALPDKINAAFANGGTKLAVKTVKNLLSRPGEPFRVNHVIQVSFTGFQDIVDYVGCVFVDIDHDYFNDIGGPGGYATIDIDPGYQKLCGHDALDYVRYRHTDSDLVRGARQQDFLRQALRQPGVKKRLTFGKRKQLAALAGKYIDTDKSLNNAKQLLSLLKLGLAVADKPIQQVPFGAGQITDDGPAYLTAPKSAIDETVEQFLNAKLPAPSKATGDRPKRKKAAGTVSGLEDDSTDGENMAILAKGKLDFPFYFPKLRVAGSTYVGEPRFYTIKDDDGDKHRAFRIVASLGVAGEYYGIQGMSWTKAPILDGSYDTVREKNRTLRVYWDGKKVRLVAWRKGNAVYYVSNSLTRTVSKPRLVAIAASLSRLGRG